MKSKTKAPHVDGDYEYLREIDSQMPLCEGKVDLQIAREFFVEIANDLPGREHYNELVRLYREKHWATLDEKWALFRKIHEGSQLQEAAAFLIVQSQFDRIEKDDGIESRGAEKSLRELLLLYPKSTLVPVILGGSGAYLMRQGMVSRSLAIYRSALEKFPAHPLACVFRIGVGEANFQLRDWKSALAAFDGLETTCSNRRIRVAADLRIAESEMALGMTDAKNRLAKLWDNYSPELSRYYPFALANYGELQYREKNYPSAKFYFSEYMRRDGREGRCIPQVTRRLADLAFRTGAPSDEVVGLYLSAHEKSPLTDIGRYAYIRALTIGFRALSEGEADRRIKVIDGELEQIKDDDLRTKAYLEKGLALLDFGDKTAIDYLERFQTKAHFPLEQGAIAQFIRERILRLLTEEIDARPPTSPERLASIEKVYPLWLKGTPFEARASALYERAALGAFGAWLEKGNPENAVGALKRWKNSEMYPHPEPSVTAKDQVRTALLKSLVLDPPDQEKTRAIAMLYLKEEESLKPFLSEDFPWVWLAVSEATGDDSRVSQLTPSARGLASKLKNSRVPQSIRSMTNLVEARALVQLKRYRDAEKSLDGVKDFAGEEVAALRLSIFLEKKEFAKAYPLAEKKYLKTKPEDKKNQLKGLYEIALEGKLWNRAPHLLEESLRLKVDGKDLAPYYYLAGRSDFELSKFKPASERFEMGLKLDPEGSESNGARYRLGKCLLKLKRKSEAVRVWEELVKVKDGFWSPLAQNEIKILQ